MGRQKNAPFSVRPDGKVIGFWKSPSKKKAQEMNDEAQSPLRANFARETGDEPPNLSSSEERQLQTTSEAKSLISNTKQLEHGQHTSAATTRNSAPDLGSMEDEQYQATSPAAFASPSSTHGGERGGDCVNAIAYEDDEPSGNMEMDDVEVNTAAKGKYNMSTVKDDSDKAQEVHEMAVRGTPEVSSLAKLKIPRRLATATKEEVQKASTPLSDKNEEQILDEIVVCTCLHFPGKVCAAPHTTTTEGESSITSGRKAQGQRKDKWKDLSEVRKWIWELDARRRSSLT